MSTLTPTEAASRAVAWNKQVPTNLWLANVTYLQGEIAVHNGGVWIETNSEGCVNSEPISGNTDWTLVGGIAYVEGTLTPPDLTTLAYVREIIPAPVGANQFIYLLDAYAEYTPGDTAYSGTDEVDLFYGSSNRWVRFRSLVLTGLTDTFDMETANSGVSPRTDLVGLALNIKVPDLTTPPFGNGIVYYRVFYRIADATNGVSPFFTITAVVQVAKTFTVSDAGAALSGATGTFTVVGSTGNNAVYTIVSAVSGAGSTVLTVVEAIPDATADGWVEAT